MFFFLAVFCHYTKEQRGKKCSVNETRYKILAGCVSGFSIPKKFGSGCHFLLRKHVQLSFLSFLRDLSFKQVPGSRSSHDKKEKYVLIHIWHLDTDLANQMKRYVMDTCRSGSANLDISVRYLSRSPRVGWVAEDKVGQVGLTVGVRLVGHGRPGQVHHVQRHKARLQQSRVRLVILKFFFLYGR